MTPVVRRKSLVEFWGASGHKVIVRQRIDLPGGVPAVRLDGQGHPVDLTAEEIPRVVKALQAFVDMVESGTSEAEEDYETATDYK